MVQPKGFTNIAANGLVMINNDNKINFSSLEIIAIFIMIYIYAHISINSNHVFVQCLSHLPCHFAHQIMSRFHGTAPMSLL